MTVRFPSTILSPPSYGETWLAISCSAAEDVTPPLLARDRRRPNSWSRRLLLELAADYLYHCYTARTAARVTELASLVLVDRSRFTRAFVHFVGKPPLKVMRDLQVVHAIFLLRTTAMTNEEIAKGAAFGTRNTFQRVFATRIGMSPAEYRKSTK
jgi:AraC-like DNA-binding protein